MYIDVNDANFETEVLVRSATVPVVVDLWAPWCGPCRSLGPIIERVVDATEGRVVLAKVNTDENPRISKTFSVQSIPAVYAIKDRKIADNFVGALPESKVKAWVAKLAPAKSQSDLLTEAGIANDDEGLLWQALDLDPAHKGAVIALASKLVDTNRSDQALALLARIPETPQSREIAARARLGDSVSLVSGGDDDHLATTTELESLLPKVKSDEAAKQRYLDLLALMGDDDRVPGLRRKLATHLF